MSVAERNETATVSSKGLERRSSLWLGVAILAVFLSRVPFLSAGYGNDWDTWRIAGTATRIAATGEYTYSRPPGHPLQEMLMAPVSRGGPLALNGITALFSAAATWLFALSLKRYGCRDYVLASLAMAFTPIVFINSTESQDFVLALAFLVGSLYCVQVHAPLIAGILLGAAVGCRITSGAMLLPLGILVYRSRPRAELTRFVAATLLTSLLVFTPVFWTYGFAFWRHTGSLHVPIIGILKVATIDVWGPVGVVALAIAAALWPLTRTGEGVSLPQVDKRHLQMWLMTIAVFTVGYVSYVLNYKGGFLIPVVPFVILCLAHVLDRRIFVGVCVALLISPFLLGAVTRSLMDTFGGPSFFFVSDRALTVDVFNDRVLLDPLNGPLLMNHERRVRNVNYISRALARARALPGSAVVVSGDWVLMIEASAGSLSHGRARFVDRITGSEAASYRRRGVDIYYLAGLREYDYEEGRVDLAALGAAPLLAIDQSTAP